MLSTCNPYQELPRSFDPCSHIYHSLHLHGTCETCQMLMWNLQYLEYWQYTYHIWCAYPSSPETACPPAVHHFAILSAFTILHQVILHQVLQRLPSFWYNLPLQSPTSFANGDMLGRHWCMASTLTPHSAKRSLLVKSCKKILSSRISCVSVRKYVILFGI